MFLIDIMAKGLQKEQKNGNNNYSILIFAIICFAIWGSFNFQKENVDKLDNRVSSVEEKVNIIDKDVAVLKATKK